MTRKETRKLKKKKFLQILSQGSSVTGAAASAGVARRTVYKWRTADPEFAVGWKDAENAGVDRIEDEAVRRAVDGVDKPIVRSGEIVGHVKEYSDSMLAMILKARRPEKYSATKSEKESNGFDFKGVRDSLFNKFAKIFSFGEG